MNRLYRYVDWLSDSYRADVRYLAAVRIGYALWVLILPTRYTWVSQVPAAFFQPRLGPTSLLSAPPSHAALVALQTLLAALALLLLVGWRTRVVSVLLSLVLVAGSGMVYSFGKVDHFILFELLPVAMAAAGWGDALSVDARRGPTRRAPSGFPVLLWAITVGYGFLTAALPKAATGWASPGREGTRGYLAREVVDPVRVGALGKWIFQFDDHLLWKALDYGTLAAEGGLVFALLYPPLFRLWTLAIIGFHVGVYLTMGISFARYVFVYLPFFAPWAVWAAARVQGAAARGGRLSAAPGGGPAPPG